MNSMNQKSLTIIFIIHLNAQIKKKIIFSLCIEYLKKYKIIFHFAIKLTDFFYF